MSIDTKPPSRFAARRSDNRRLSQQSITLVLDGITADDYLAWVRDPEPPALGRELREIRVQAQPLADRIEIELMWDREPPAAGVALVVAGFRLIPEVVVVYAGRDLHARAA